MAALRNRADIVVACPGRLADLIEQGHCHLGDVEISVLDEADHMADLGFLPVVRRLLEATPPESQRMLFSATLDNAVDVLVRRFLSDPAVHSVDSATVAPGAMVHHLLTVTPGDRVGVVAALAGGNNRSLVFTRTKHGAQALTRQLARAGVSVAELHGNLGQNVRERNLASFASGAARVLVATDIAARGIHVDGIDLVIHADPPAEHKAYLHRSGRTARAGADGVVITVQSPGPGRRRAGADAPRGREPAALPASAPAPTLLRSIAGPPAARADAAAASLRSPSSADGQPRHRPRRSGHVRRLPGAPEAVEHRPDATPWSRYQEGHEARGIHWPPAVVGCRVDADVCVREGARIFGNGRLAVWLWISTSSGGQPAADLRDRADQGSS